MSYAAKGRIQVVKLSPTSPCVPKEPLERFNSVNIGDFVKGQFFIKNNGSGPAYLQNPFEGIIVSKDIFCYVTDKIHRASTHYKSWRTNNQQQGHMILTDQDNFEYELAGKVKARALVIIKRTDQASLPKHKDLKDGYVISGINIWKWVVTKPCDVNSLLTHDCERIRKVGIWLTSATPGDLPNVLRY